jgi:hypothetical protein
MAKKMFLLVGMVVMLGHWGFAQSVNPLTPKRADKALRYSLFGTLVPVAAGGVIFFGVSDKFENWDDGESIVAVSIAGFGIIFGPAFGHCYAGQREYLAKGFLIRGLTAGLVVGVSAFASGLSSSMGGSWSPNPGIILIPSCIILASAIYDIATVEDSVNKYNRKHGLSEITLLPTYFADEKAPGLVLSVNF